MKDHKLGRSYGTWSRFLLLYIPLLLFISGIALYVYYAERQTRHKLFHQQEEVCVENHSHSIMDRLQVVKSDLLFLSLLEEFGAATSTLRESERISIANEFLSFSVARKEYDQIRFIDLDGMERVRINYDDGSPNIVPTDQLQSKGKRYYFRDALKLDRNNIYLSPFDRNIEHGRIEEPFKPVIRFARLVFNADGNRVGVIVLNFLGQNILDELREELHCDHGCRIMLLNRNGFWLRGPVPENEWAFMFKGREDQSFANHFPEEWQRIRTAAGEGHFSSENGYFTFSTIYPLESKEVSSTGHREPFSGSLKQLSGEEYHWKLVTQILPDLYALPPHFFLKLLSGYLSVSFLVAIIALLYARAVEKRKNAETDLENIFNTSIPICITDTTNRIVLFNKAYKEIFPVGNERSKSPIKCYESRPGPACHTDACPLARVLNGEEAVVCEPSKVCSDGTEQHFIVTAQPFLNRHGRIEGIVECFQDITDRRKAEKERDKLLEELRSALSKVKLLSGFLPICASCKKIRDDKGYWNQIEYYVREHSEAEFTHGICPDCANKLYPGVAD